MLHAIVSAQPPGDTIKTYLADGAGHNGLQHWATIIMQQVDLQAIDVPMQSATNKTMPSRSNVTQCRTTLNSKAMVPCRATAMKGQVQAV
jgi:hypothetical protein